QTIEQSLGNDGKFFRKDPLGVFFLEAMRNGIEIRADSLQADARLKAPHKLPSTVERRPIIVTMVRQPAARVKGVKPRRHDSYQRGGLPVKSEAAAKDIRVATEFTLPKPVAHHENQRGTRSGIFLRDPPAEE